MSAPIPVSRDFDLAGDCTAVTFDGMTIVRFVRGYSGGAGLEYDVAMVNRALCERHQLTIHQVQFARPGESLEPVTRVLGRGRITTHPLRRAIPPAPSFGNRTSMTRAVALRFREAVRDAAFSIHSIRRYVYERACQHPPKRGADDGQGVGKKIHDLLTHYNADIVMIHAGGGRDAWEAIHEAQQAGVPVAMQLHFSNARFQNYSVRIQAANVDAVGGVSDVRVPSYLDRHFRNLLTAVDADYFSNVGIAVERTSRPQLLLPARIVPEKGHADLIRVAALLGERGLSVDIAFAGRPDQPEFEEQLRHRARELGVADRVHFHGLLEPAELRDLYAASTLLVFPTYHAEGLPRVLLEAQAMELPVVVYDSGGSRAAFLPNQSGYLVSTGDIHGLASAVESLLRNSVQMAAFGRTGRAYVTTTFTTTSLADRHEQFIADAIRSKARAAARS